MRPFPSLFSVGFISASVTGFTWGERCLKQQPENTCISVNPPTSKIVSTKERRRKKTTRKQELCIDRVPLKHFQRAPLPALLFDFALS